MKIFKKYLSILLSITFCILGITPLQSYKQAVAATTTTLSNPRIDTSGISTWDCIYFGNYWQNDTNGDGVADQRDEKEPIKWRILSVNGNNAFLLADCNLDCQRYNISGSQNVTWETCTLRSWLNGYGSNSNDYESDYSNDNFINEAFSKEEQSAIYNTNVVNYNNPYYNTDGGSNTMDKVYLLSIDEATMTSYGFNSEYYTDTDTRIAINTDYAKSQGIYTYFNYTNLGSGWWWLRSSGNVRYNAARVDCGGYGYNYGIDVNNFYDNAVRPVLHLDLSYSNLYSYAGMVSSDGKSTDVPVSSSTPSPNSTNLFNEYIYRADHLTDTSEVEGSAMENGYINADTPSEILLKELQKNGFSYTADAWRAVTRACDSASDASKIVDYAVEEKDIYEAIILNSLESAAKYDVVDSINADVIKETNELLQLIKNDLKMNYSIDIYDSTQNTNLTKEMRIRTKELAEEYYEQKNISKAAEWLGNFEEVMAYLDTAEDFCEELTSYINIRNMNDSMKSVLKEMKKNCPSNNKALAFALDDCVKVLDTSDSEFAKQMLEGGLKTVGAEAVKAGISKFWGKIVVAKVEKLCPRVVIIKAAYKTSKYLTNLVFNTDEITEKYYKMIAATEFTSLIRNTYSSLKNTYLKGGNVENAKAYLSAIDVMFNAISSDCDSAYAYVDSVDSANLSKICKLFGCSSNSSSLKASIESIKSSNKLEHEGILTSWVNYLPEDFPEEYPHYTRLFDESNNRLKEYQIHCPVDVYVYDSANKLVASVINNIPSSSGLAVVVDGNEKILYLPEGEQYSISYIGNDTGVMDIEIAEYDTNGIIIRNANFNNIALSKGRKYSSNENGKFLADAEYIIADSNNKNKAVDFDSYLQDSRAKHIITIEQGIIFNKDVPNYTIEAYENEVLDISAYIPNGYELDVWEVTSGNIEIKDINSSDTKAIVGNGDATIKAILRKSSASEGEETPLPSSSPSANATSKPNNTVKPSEPATQTKQPNTSPSSYVPSIGSKLKDNKGNTYKVTKSGKTGGVVTFIKAKNKKVKTISIPANVTIDGISYKVTSIANKAIRGNTKLRKVTIGKNVNRIGKQAFYGCKSLKIITIMTTKLTKKSIGDSAFKNISPKATIKVPKRKLSTYKKIIRKSGIGKNVKVKK